MEYNYLVGLHQVEAHMKKQFEYAEEPQPEPPGTRRQRVTVTERTRLAIGTALYRLASAIDPAAPVPNRQH